MATTDPVKSVQRHLLGAMADVMAALASAAHAPAVTGAQVRAALVIAVMTVLVIAQPVKTEVRVWAIRLSAPSAKPWSALKCRCASWPRKPTARPWAVS